jgi:hypothetical protein
MQERTLTLPLLFLVAGTRVALGVGLGLLLAGRMSRDARQGAGWGLLAVGALSTVPLALEILGKPQITGPASS